MNQFEPEDDDALIEHSQNSWGQEPPAQVEGSDRNSGIDVELGQVIPPRQLVDVAKSTDVEANTAQVKMGQEFPQSVLAEGLFFTGNGVLKGPCSVACSVKGNLVAASGFSVSVVVTETGVVDGDITAEKISVMGNTNGILDSGMGDVVLYESASVQGLVRYGRIQVNGADLNATLERVARK